MTRAEYYKSTGRFNESRFNESTSDYEFTLIFTNNSDDFSVKLDRHNYKNVKEIQKEMTKQSELHNGSDDVWVDEVMLNKGVSESDEEVDWTDLIKDLDQKIINLIFEEDDIALKISFLKDYHGSRLEADDILKESDKIKVMKFGNNAVYDRYNEKYPEEFVNETFGLKYPSLLKELEKSNTESYFDKISVISDMDANGEFRSLAIYSMSLV